MSIAISRELAAAPTSGALPFEPTLTFRAAATDDDVLTDVVYRIVEVAGEPLDVAFETAKGPFKTLRREKVTFTALPQDVAEPMRLIPAGKGDKPKLVTIWASIVAPDTDDDTSPIERTACTVRIQ